MPSGSISEHGRRCSKLFDEQRRIGRRRHRQRRVASRIARVRRRDRRKPKKRPRRDRFVEQPFAIELHAQRLRTVADVPTADHQVAALQQSTNPRVDAAGSQTATISHSDAASFGRERPAFADVPRRLFDAVPVHLVRPDATEEHGVRQRPSIRRRLVVLHQFDARAQRIDDEPDGRAAAAVPVLHGLEPFVLGRRRQLTIEARRRVAEPFERPAQIETLAAIGREHGTHGLRRRRALHVVEQTERRRLLRGERGDRGAADVPVVHRQRQRQQHCHLAREAAQSRDREKRDRDHERQRITARECFLKQHVEDEVRNESDRQPRERRALPSPELPDTNARGCEHERRDPPGGPRRDQRVVHRVDDVACAVVGPEHLDISEILCTLIEECVPVRDDAAAQDDERERPDEDACQKRQTGDEKLATGEGTQPARDQQRHREPRHLRPDADRESRGECRRRECSGRRCRQRQRLDRDRGGQAGRVAQRARRREVIKRRRHRDGRGGRRHPAGRGV